MSFNLYDYFLLIINNLIGIVKFFLEKRKSFLPLQPAKGIRDE
ncbi:hypothetical protein SAMN05216436_1281 [bacterium A37T11]|nr:hypothetical protein SAMN05216436_1281 [bacterium A37T11]